MKNLLSVIERHLGQQIPNHLFNIDDFALRIYSWEDEVQHLLCLCFAGESLKTAAKKFTDDPCYLPKREAVVQVARALLAAVTRLLILADMIDVSYLLQHLTTVSSCEG